MADAMTAFAELGEELPERLTEDGVVLDGWLLALDDGGWLDTDLLRRRLAGEHGAGASGFVASDLLWSDGAPWHGGDSPLAVIISPACSATATAASSRTRFAARERSSPRHSRDSD